jgi:nucleotide-binding universal stress UspA family protein
MIKDSNERASANEADFSIPNKEIAKNSDRSRGKFRATISWPSSCSAMDTDSVGGRTMKILLAVDGSECSDVVVEEVAKRPWPAGSALRIISVAETLPPEVLSLHPRYREDVERAVRHRAETIVERAIARLRDSDARFLPISSTVVVDSPKDAIVEEAERWGADLIVVGSHGYRGPERLLLGSVSQAVATQAKCSVEIARRRRVDEDEEC